MSTPTSNDPPCELKVLRSEFSISCDLQLRPTITGGPYGPNHVIEGDHIMMELRGREIYVVPWITVMIYAVYEEVGTGTYQGETLILHFDTDGLWKGIAMAHDQIDPLRDVEFDGIPQACKYVEETTQAALDRNILPSDEEIGVPRYPYRDKGEGQP